MLSPVVATSAAARRCHLYLRPSLPPFVMDALPVTAMLEKQQSTYIKYVFVADLNNKLY